MSDPWADWPKKSGMLRENTAFCCWRWHTFLKQKGGRWDHLKLRENKRVVGPWQILHGKRMKIWSYLKLSKYGLNMDTMSSASPEMGATRICLWVAKTSAVWDDAAEERCVRSTQGWLRPCIMGEGWHGISLWTRVGSDLEHKKWWIAWWVFDPCMVLKN